MYAGRRNYELTNHLGNVIAVINDRRIDSLIGAVKTYNAVVISATDYYPFGMAMGTRSYSSSAYRMGFNGKENNPEWGTQDYGMRIYEPGLGRFLSIDPISKKYPELTPYQFASNTPIQAIDLDGLEELHFLMDQAQKYKGYALVLKILNETGVTTELVNSYKKDNTQTDMYLAVERNENLQSMTEGAETKVYAGYKSVRVPRTDAEQSAMQNSAYRTMRHKRPNLSEGDGNYMWNTTFKVGKGAVLVSLGEDMINNVGGDLNRLAQATLTAIHEMWAHGLKLKNGDELTTDYQDHLPFFGETYNKFLSDGGHKDKYGNYDGYYSPKYENIDPNSIAGKFKARIEKYIKAHKEELTKLMSSSNTKNEANKQ